MEGGAWQATVHGVAKSQTRLSDFTYLLTYLSIELVMPSNHLILCHPLLLLPSIFLSIRVFSNESALCIVAKVLELQLQYQSSSEQSGLISFRIDWFDLLAVQGTLKNLLQHHSSEASNMIGGSTKVQIPGGASIWIQFQIESGPQEIQDPVGSFMKGLQCCL